MVLLLGRWPLPALGLLWALYLSLVTAGQSFLAFQWDNLLLEAGLLALLVAPATLRLRLDAPPEPPPWGRWLLWWLVVRLQVSSGWVKLASGDPAWRSLTALEVHYETQPLPTWIGWMAHQLPAWWHRLSTATTFAIELVVPWLVFTTARLRRVAALAMTALQLLIALTGNYTYFNLLTILLCLPLLDDELLPAPVRAPVAATPQWPSAAWRRGTLPLATVLFSLSLLQAAATTGAWRSLPRPALAPLEWVRPLRSVNGYGLFAVMTTERPEIVIEGSLDGEEWRSYSFRWKAGPLNRRPRFVAPHQPRLDWQMWFAALGDYRSNPWLGRLLDRLLDAEPAVLDLLAADPFDGARPRLVRARLYRYRFTDWRTLRDEGRWWRRELLGPYSPVISRRRQPGDG